ncbi:Gag-pol Polyprotein [Phytophthora palmivora]|uniref:Gag-pol Polyprotein n=1 Tax=Phytophthora palmivora TaxID=4796 RepID=A0A2P4XMW0_9STRA|nr:Gag-pol Polyprotein [Phytophthora palmivora]
MASSNNSRSTTLKPPHLLFDREVIQYDVKTVFLYEDLDEVIYMEQPPGFQVDRSSVICQLLKSLYGLKQP